jgi:hypothetical protein
MEYARWFVGAYGWRALGFFVLPRATQITGVLTNWWFGPEWLKTRFLSESNA